jgi:cytochrome c-type biogenesis protein
VIENVTLLAAFGAGLLSFISPCVLPLIPGYLSYISGLSLDEMRGTGTAAIAAPVRNRVIMSSLAFILGFSLVFVALGASASVIGQFLMSRLTLMGRIAGAIIVLFGLHTMGLLRMAGCIRRNACRRIGGRRDLSAPRSSASRSPSDGRPASVRSSPAFSRLRPRRIRSGRA